MTSVYIGQCGSQSAGIIFAIGTLIWKGAGTVMSPNIPVFTVCTVGSTIALPHMM